MALDSPALAGRWRSYDARGSLYEHRKIGQVHPRLVRDVHVSSLKHDSAVQTNSSQTRTPASAAAPARSAQTPVKSTALPSLLQPHQPPFTSARNRPATVPSRIMRSQVLSRINLSRPARRRVHRSARKNTLLTAMAVALCLLGVFVAVNGFMTDRQVTSQVQHITKQVSASVAGSAAAADVPPSETKPAASSLQNYVVAPSLPRELKIPSIGVDTRIVQLGTLKDGELATPSTIFDAGWYNASSKPGEQGAELLDGHVSGPTQHGVFYNLKQLKPGDAITVQRGDGQNFTYHVVTSKVYDAGNVDMASALTPITTGKPGLNLITCTGKLDSSHTHFQQRVVVFASM